MNLSELPEDIIEYIKKCTLESKIDELKIAYVRKINEYLIMKLKIYHIFTKYIFDEKILHMIMINLKNNFEEFKQNSKIDLDYFRRSTSKKLIKKLYRYDIQIRKLNGFKLKASYKFYKKYIHAKFNHHYEGLLKRAFTFLHENKEHIHNYINDENIKINRKKNACNRTFSK